MKNLHFKWLLLSIILSLACTTNVWGATITWNFGSESSTLTKDEYTSFTGSDASTVLKYMVGKSDSWAGSAPSKYLKMNGASTWSSNTFTDRYFTFKAPSSSGTITITYAVTAAGNAEISTVQTSYPLVKSTIIGAVSSSITSDVITGLTAGTTDIYIFFPKAKAYISSITWTDATLSANNVLYSSDYKSTMESGGAVATSGSGGIITSSLPKDVGSYTTAYKAGSSEAYATVTFSSALSLNSDGNDRGYIEIEYTHSGDGGGFSLYLNGGGSAVASFAVPKGGAGIHTARYIIPDDTTKISSIKTLCSSSSTAYLFHVKVVTHSAADHWYVYGNFSDGSTWTDTEVAMDGYVDINIPQDAHDYSFKIKHTRGASTWYSGENGIMSRGECTNWDLDEDANVTLRTDISGTYRFALTLNSSTPRVTVTYPTGGVAVTLVLNNGGSNYSWYARSGEPITIPNFSPSYEGYGFDGWYANEECTTPWLWGTTVNSATTLYAKWSHSWYFRGSADWSKYHLMSRSTLGSYWYYACSKGGDHNEFLAHCNGNNYGNAYNAPGHMCTNVTNMNSSGNNWGHGVNSAIYESESDYYVLVFPPHTAANATDDPKICAHKSLPEEFYSVEGGINIYFDNSDVKWENVYFRKGRSCHNEASAMSKVSGTDNLYKLTVAADYNGCQAFHIANNQSWTDGNSIYKVDGTGYAITEAIEFQKYTLNEDVTFTPGDEGDKDGDCQYYVGHRTFGMKTDRVTISPYSHGTITVNYTNTSGSAATLTSGSADLAHTVILTSITAEPANGYEIDDALTINKSAYSANYVVTGPTTIAASFKGIVPDAPSAAKITATDGCSAGATFSADISGLPSYVTWYWQTSSSGTSTDYPASSNYTTDSEAGSKTIYLRAKNTVTGDWSTSSASKSATVRTAVTVSWNTQPADGVMGESMTASVTTNYSDGVAYSVTSASPAGCVTINGSTGAISYVAGGTATIRATVTGSGDYCSSAYVEKSITSKVSVTYAKNNGSATGSQSDGSSPYPKDSRVTVLDQNDMALSNNQFVGWNTETDGTGTWYSPGANFAITTNTTLNAQWRSTSGTTCPGSSGGTVFSLSMGDNSSGSAIDVAAGQTINIGDLSYATLTNGAAQFTDVRTSGTAGETAQITNNKPARISFVGNDAMMTLYLDCALEEDDEISFTGTEDVELSFSLLPSRGTTDANIKASTSSKSYTIPAESPLIGAKILYVWRKTTSTQHVTALTITRPADCSAPTSPGITGTTSYTAGETISLTASATGTSGSTTYQWYLGDPTDDGVSQGDASTSGATFSKSAVVADDGSTYYCVISNGEGCTATVYQAITVTCASVAAPTALTCSAQTINSLTFTWTKESNASAYTATLYSDSDCKAQVASQSLGDVATVTFSTLSVGTTYYCKVQSVGNGTVYCDDGGTTSKAEGTTLHQYAISYDKGTYGTGSISGGMKTEGSAFTLSSEKFTRSGYVQTGWALTDGGTKVYELGGSYTTDVAQTFYPVWSVVYTVSFNTNGAGGSVSPIEQSTYGGSITMPSAPSYTNYTFQGWVIGGTTKAVGASYTPTANVTAYASWRADCADEEDETLASAYVTSGYDIAATVGSAAKSNWSTNVGEYEQVGSTTEYANKLNSSGYVRVSPKAGSSYAAGDKVYIRIYNGETSNKEINVALLQNDGSTKTELSATTITTHTVHEFEYTLTANEIHASGYIQIMRGATQGNHGWFVATRVVHEGGPGTCYYVTYDGNGADSGCISDATAYKSGANVTVLGNTGGSAFVRDGYTFAGWKDGSGNPYTAGGTISGISGNVTLYAQWTSGYSITYNCDDPDSGCPDNASNQTALPNPLPSAPSKSGYTFDGWYTNSGKTDKAVAGATLDANVTLYAKWLTNHTVTAAYGTGGTAAAASTTVAESKTTTVTATPSTGYTFSSWAVSGTGATLSSTSDNPTTLTMGTADATVTATFSAKTYTLTLKENGGTGGDGSATITWNDRGVSYSSQPSAPNESFRLDGYYTAATGGTKIISGSIDGGSEYIVGEYVEGWTTNDSYYKWAHDGNATLYAYWRRSINLNANWDYHGTYPNYGSVTVMLNGAPISYTTATGESGYILQGYYTDKLGGTKVFNADGTYADDNVDGYIEDGKWVYTTEGTLSFYAHWAKEFTVTYDGNSQTTGTAPAAQTNKAYGTTVTVASNSGSLVKTGYTFVGWNTANDGSGTFYAVGSTFTVTGNITLYAQWATGGGGSTTLKYVWDKTGNFCDDESTSVGDDYITIPDNKDNDYFALSGTGYVQNPTGKGSFNLAKTQNNYFLITAKSGYQIQSICFYAKIEDESVAKTTDGSDWSGTIGSESSSENRYYSFNNINTSKFGVKLTEASPKGIWIRNMVVVMSSASTSYTVSFANMTGFVGETTLPSTITGVPSGAKIAEPVSPKADGYAFAGWYKEGACTNKWDFATDVVSSAKTLYAKWIDIDDTYTFHMGDGDIDNDSWKVLTFAPTGYANDQAITNFEIPNQTRYPSLFVGYEGEFVEDDPATDDGWSYMCEWDDYTNMASYYLGKIHIQGNAAPISDGDTKTAEGAIGTLQMSSTTHSRNWGLTFIPKGFGLTIAYTEDETPTTRIIPLHQTDNPNIWETESFTAEKSNTLTSDQVGGTFKVGLATKTDNVYVDCYQSTAEAASAINARKLDAAYGGANIAAGASGRFQIILSSNSSTPNFGLRWVPLENHTKQYGSWDGMGSATTLANKWSLGHAPTIDETVYVEHNTTITNDAQANSIFINKGESEYMDLTIASTGSLLVANDIQAKTSSDGGYRATTAKDLRIETNYISNGALVTATKSTNTNASYLFSTKAYKLAGYGYINQFIGIPFTELSAYQLYGALLYQYDAKQNKWVTCSTTMIADSAYNILRRETDGRGEFLIDGTLNLPGIEVGDKEKVLTCKGGRYAEASSWRGEHLFANSWTAPIDVKAMTEGDFSNVDPTIYIFNAGSVNSASEEQKSEYDLGNNPGQWTALPVNDVKLNPGNFPYTVIPAMQAFSIRATALNGTLTLDYKKHVYEPIANSGAADHTSLRAPKQNTDIPSVRLWLIVTGENGYRDDAQIHERADFSDGHDAGWDGYKIFGNAHSPQLYTMSDNSQLSVNAIPNMEGTVVGFRKGSDDNAYTFSFKYDGEEEYYLNDLKEQTSSAISNENTYMFTAESGDTEARFIISKTPIHKTPTDIGPTDGKQEAKVRKVLIDDHVYIIRGGRMYNATGALVK